VLLGMGNREAKLGRNDEAPVAYDKAFPLYKTVGDRLGEANVLLGMGHLESRLGRTDDARKAYGKAHQLHKTVGNRLGEANVLRGLGHLEVSLGREDKARKHFEAASILYGLMGMKKKKEEAERLATTNFSPKPVWSKRFRRPFRDWSRNDKLAVVTLLVAIAGILIPVFLPEIRAWLGSHLPLTLVSS